MDRGNRFAVPLKERRDVMLQKFFENIFDVELYCQMVDLILRLSENTNREQAYREFQDHALFFSCPEQGVEERYGLHYPGEVLERLEEKMEVKVEQLRSLGLALAETRKFQNAGMFVGKQKASFWKKFRRILAKNDIYMMGILYLCDDKEKSKLYQKMCNCPIQELQELLFMLHMFVYDDEFWETRKHDLNQLLGTERNFSVYAYKEVYIWLTEKFSCKLKNYHKKDIEVLKYLFRLPCSYAKEGGTGRKKLLEAGYSKREIMFLSMTLLFQTDLYTKLKIDGMTAERMAVETCLLFLSGQEDYSQEAYELCRTLFEKYRYFPVRLEGENGIMDYLYYRLEVQNIKTYQLLYECDNYRERHSNWFLIDLTDTKWHELKQILTPDAAPIKYLRLLLRYLEPEDKRSEWEKDVWKLENFGFEVRQNPIDVIRTIKFTGIIQETIREEVKRASYIRIKYLSVGSLQGEIRAVRRFSEFLAKRNPEIKSLGEVGRLNIEEYLTYINLERGQERNLKTEMANLKNMLQQVGKVIDKPKLGKLFIKQDMPKAPEVAFKIYSDEEIKRLNYYIVNMEEQVARALILHQMLGGRISDTLTLRTDCLYQENGHYIVRMYQVKTSYYEKPIPDDVAKLIQKSIEYTYERYGETEYVFVNESNPSLPFQYSMLKHRVYTLIHENDICKDNGERMGFATHLFRHCYGMKLVELHLDDAAIAHLLGHRGVNTVYRYRRASGKLLVKETEELRKTMDEILSEIIKEWDGYEQVFKNG